MAKESFAREMNLHSASAGKSQTCRFYNNTFTTDAVLLGIGAPIHIFLPDVAKALHTTWKVSEYSSVSNALGAMLGNVCAYETVSIRVDYIDPKADIGNGPFIFLGINDTITFFNLVSLAVCSDLICRLTVFC